ncbi:MAG: efflux RND transporter periplasmic adaptor subunit [Steroidobacteraceae bacterium]|nr:efflux RND transporter periplasmic adaptor subunit [Steroidobacteraceae bacterium]
MSDFLKKALLGAVVGAIVVGFAWHTQNERLKHAPAAPSPAPAAAPGSAGGASGAPAAGGTAMSQVAVRVIVAPVRNERLTAEIEALGTANANESIDVTAKVSNLVTAVRFEEGQQVQKGNLLIELDGAQARAELAIAEAAVTESRSQYKRSRELYTTKALSEAQLDQIEAALKANEARVAVAQARLADTMIRAPFAGRVGLRRVSPGSLVNPGTVITTLDDTATIKLDFTVPESYLSTLAPGLPITALSIAYPGRTFEGKVSSVDSRVDPNTRSVTVRALVPNPENLLKPGMFMNVRLERGAADALLVPEQALVPEQGDVFVFVLEGDAVAKRLIRIGQRRVGDVQVLQGLSAGDLVVTEGTQKLRDGVRVTVVDAAAEAATKSGAAAP